MNSKISTRHTQSRRGWREAFYRSDLPEDHYRKVLGMVWSAEPGEANDQLQVDFHGERLTGHGDRRRLAKLEQICVRVSFNNFVLVIAFQYASIQISSGWEKEEEATN